MPQYIQCTLTFVLLCAPFLFADNPVCRFMVAQWLPYVCNGNCSYVMWMIAEPHVLLFFVSNAVKRAEHMKCNGLFALESIINSWGAHSDEKINSGAILSFDVVCAGSPVIIMSQKKEINKYIRKIRILSLNRDHRKFHYCPLRTFGNACLHNPGINGDIKQDILTLQPNTTH